MKIKTPFFIIEFEIIFLIVFFSFIFSNELKKILFSFYICYLFIIFHELSHMLIAGIFGKEVRYFKFSLAGVSISFKENKNLTRYKEILIYLAGPISNLILALLFYYNRMIFEVNIGLSIVNLLPLYPLDGYNILYYILLNNKFKYSILNRISIFILIFLCVMSILELLYLKKIEIMMFVIYVILLNMIHKKEVKYDRISRKIRY
jgi:stage IV sporulation protein FB